MQCLRTLSGTKKGVGRTSMWFRTSILFMQDKGWKIAHLHNSVPFAMDGSDKALLHLHP